MANRFWVGGTGTWDTSTTTHWSASSGGASGASAPTSADDVFIDGNSGVGTVTLGSSMTIPCRSLDCTGFTGTMAMAGGAIFTVGDASGGALKLSAGMTLANPTLGNFTFVSTSTNSGTGWPITTAGKTVPAVQFTGAGGKWVLQDSMTSGVATSQFNVLAGTFVSNGQTITCGLFNSSGTTTRTVDITNSTVTCNGTGSSMNASSFGGLTFVATGSTVNITGTVALLNGFGSATFNNVNFTGAGAQRISTNSGATLTFNNLTRTGTAVKTDSFQIDKNSNSTVVVTGTLTLGGNSTQGVNRLLVQGTVTGTQTIVNCTGAAVVINGDVDFMDTTITGSPSWTNSGNAYIGDCGGNGTLITTNRTTPAAQTITAGSAWSTGTWTSRVPLPQDNVTFGAGQNGSLSVDMPRIGADIDTTGGSGNFTTAVGISPTLFGSATFGGKAFTSNQQWFAAGRGTHTFTSNGQNNTGAWTFQGPGGTYTLQDPISCTGSLTLNDGTWNSNDKTITVQRFTAASGRAQTVNLGTSTVNIMDTAGSTLVNTSAGIATYNMSQATFVLANPSTGLRTFGLGSSHTIGAITYTVANSPGMLSISSIGGGSTVSTLNIGSARQLQIQSAGALTVSNFNVNGVANGYLYLPGTSGNTINVPDSAALDITGDIDLRVRVALDDWTPAAATTFLAKYGGTPGTDQSYALRLAASGQVLLLLHDGTTGVSATSSLVTGISDGTSAWIRATWRQSDGRVQFFTANGALANPVAADFTQLGTDQTATLAAIFSGSGGLTIGSRGSFPGNSEQAIGKFYRAQVRNGIDGTLVFDADFTDKNAGSNNWSNATKTTFTENSTNAATVTINGSLAQVGDGRIAITATTFGSRSTLVKSSGIVSSSYLSIQDSAADGGASWHATSSIDAGNNTGWIFASTPNVTGNFTIFGGTS